jgi:glycerol kinase
MSFQADVLGVRLIRPREIETTVLGAAFLAGLGVGLWPSIRSLQSIWKADREFSPRLGSKAREVLLHQWREIVAKA